MAFRREPKLSWLSVYPVEKEVEGWDAGEDKAVYVNMGGGIGHQCRQFKEKYPGVKGRVVLQDLPHSIDKALDTPGVENCVHNFFEPQPITGKPPFLPCPPFHLPPLTLSRTGAKFYFLRGVLHNHPDHKVRQLLLNVKAAMSSDSVLLIDEMVLPESGVNAYAAAMDLTMMAAFASTERSEKMWRKIIEDVGMRLVKTWPYNEVSYESVMDVRLA